jgi:hypothetical protein
MQKTYQKRQHKILMQVKYDLLRKDKGKKTDHITPGKGFGL